METITLTPEQIRAKFGSYFHIEYNYKQHTKNEDDFGTEIGREDYIGVPFFDISLTNFLKYYPKPLFHIVEMIGKPDPCHPSEEIVDFNTIEEAKSRIVLKNESEIQALRTSVSFYEQSSVFNFALSLHKKGVHLGFKRIKKGFEQYLKFKKILDNFSIDKENIDFTPLKDKRFLEIINDLDKQFYVVSKELYTPKIEIIPVTVVNIYASSFMEKDGVVPFGFDLVTTMLRGDEARPFCVTIDNVNSSDGKFYKLTNHGEFLCKNKDDAISYVEKEIEKNILKIKQTEELLNLIKSSEL